jgi:RNA-binding protein
VVPLGSQYEGVNEVPSKKELRKRAHHLKPVVAVGKNGLTDAVIAEVKSALKRDKLIKIKLARGAVDGYDKDDIIEELMASTDSEVIEKKGFTVVLYKP